MQIRFLAALGLALILFPFSAAAQLQASDPKNFFALLETAPLVVRASVQLAEGPKAGRRFFLYRAKILEPLKGGGEKRLGILDEPLAPAAKPLLPEDGELLLFLEPVPPYTAYQEARGRGYGHRVVGGKSGVWPWTEAVASLARSYLAGDARQRATLRIQALQGGDARLANDAALGLGEGAAPALGVEDVAVVVEVVREGPLSSAAKVALVRALANSGTDAGLEGLKRIADGPPSPAKWAAIRALDTLGAPRPTERLADDFRRGNDEDKAQALAAIVPRRDAAAASFLSGILAGPFSLDVKKSALRAMAVSKSPGYEELLLKQVGEGDAVLRAEAVLALGKMGSSQAVPIVIPLLDSPLAPLRAAAFLMLSESSDPRARQLIQSRYTRDHHGVWEENQHFYEGAGTGQKP